MGRDGKPQARLVVSFNFSKESVWQGSQRDTVTSKEKEYTEIISDLALNYSTIKDTYETLALLSFFSPGKI